MTKTIAEQISAWEAELDRVEAKATAIQTKASDEGRTKDEDEQDKFDELQNRGKAIKKEISDLRALEELKAADATPVSKSTDTKDVAANRSEKNAVGDTTVIGPNKNIPKGIPFARMVMCLGAAKGNELAAADLARRVYADDARIAKYLELKAAVPAAYTGDGDGWAEDIAEPNTISTEFIEFLRPNNIVDRLADQMTRVPFNVKVARDTTGMTGYWVGENLPIPMTSTVYDTVTLGKTKVGSIAAMTKEQMRFSNISAETAIRNNLGGAVNARMDTSFVSADAAAAGVSPAGLLDGVSALASAGDTADNARTDLVNLFEPFSTADISRSRLVYVTTENIGYALRIMKSSLGVFEFPEVREGNLDGRPLVMSNHVSGGDLIAISAPDILLADDGEISVELSDQVSLEMLDASLVQDGTAGTGASLWSTWQNEAVAIKITRYVNWQKGRSAAVAYVGDATYQGAATT